MLPFSASRITETTLRNNLSGVVTTRTTISGGTRSASAAQRNRNEVVRYLTSVYNLMFSARHSAVRPGVFRAGRTCKKLHPEFPAAVAVIAGGQLTMVQQQSASSETAGKMNIKSKSKLSAIRRVSQRRLTQRFWLMFLYSNPNVITSVVTKVTTQVRMTGA